MCSRTTITYSSNLNVMRFFVFFLDSLYVKKKQQFAGICQWAIETWPDVLWYTPPPPPPPLIYRPPASFFIRSFRNVLFLVFFLSTRCSIASLPAVGSPAMVRKRFDYLAAQGFQQTQFLSSEFLAAQTFVPAILICLQAFVRAAILIRRVGQLLFASTYEGCNQIQYMTGQSVTRRTFAH